MARQISEVTRLKDTTETPIEDSTIPKLRSVPTDAQIHELPEEYPIDAADDSHQGLGN